VILRRGGPGDEGGEQGAASQYGGNSIYFCVTGLNLDLEFANQGAGSRRSGRRRGRPGAGGCGVPKAYRRAWPAVSGGGFV